MEYIMLSITLLYLFYFGFCIRYFTREPLLKPHEKANWIFLSLVAPLFAILVYRLVKPKPGQRTPGSTL